MPWVTYRTEQRDMFKGDSSADSRRIQNHKRTSPVPKSWAYEG